MDCVLSELVWYIVVCLRVGQLHGTLVFANMRPRARVCSDAGGLGGVRSAPARVMTHVRRPEPCGQDSPRGEYIQSNTMLIYIQLQQINTTKI